MVHILLKYDENVGPNDIFQESNGYVGKISLVSEIQSKLPRTRNRL